MVNMILMLVTYWNASFSQQSKYWKYCANLSFKKLDTMLLKDEADIEIFTALDYIFEPWKLFSKARLNNVEKLLKNVHKITWVHGM